MSINNNMSAEKLTVQMQEPQALFRQANSLFANGQFDRAVDLYRACIEKDNNFADAYFQLAEILCQQGKPSEAVVFYRQANTLKDRNLLVKSRAAENGGLNGGSNGSLTGSITMPKQQFDDRDRLATTEAYIQQAEAYLKQGDSDRAIAACQQVLRANPNTASAYKVIGNALQTQGKNQEAMRYYAKALDIEPKFAKVYANLGSLYAQEKLWQQAIAAYQKAIEIEPNFVGFYRNLGKIAQASGNSALANKCRLQALKLEPGQAKPEELLNLGNSLLQQGQTQEAIACYQSAIEIDPRFAAAYQNMGEAYAKAGNLSEALNCYRRANQLHLEPNSVKQATTSAPGISTINPAIFSFGDTLESATASQNTQETVVTYLSQAQTALESKLWQQSIELCQQVLRIKPDAEVAYKILGNAMQSTGQATQAMQCYLQALQIRSNFPEVLANIGSLYAQQQQWQQAISHYQAAIAAKPDFVGAYRNLEKILTQLGKLGEAAECKYRALQLDPERASAADLSNVGNALSQHGKVNEAIAAYQQAIQKDPNFIGAYFNLATVLSQQGQLAEANALYRKAIEINMLGSNSAQQTPGSTTKQQTIPSQSSQPVQAIPATPAVTGFAPEDRDRDLQRAEAYLKSQDYERAIALCQQVASNSPHTPYAKPSTGQQKAAAWRIMGIASQALGQWEDAVEYYRGALELQPKSVELYDCLGQLYATHKQWQEAIAAYRKAIALDPKCASAHRHLAGAFMQMGQKSDGAEAWFQAFQLEPDWATAEEHLNLGNMLLEQNKLDKAVSCYHHAIQIDPNLSQAHHNLGEVLSSQKDWEGAIAAYRKAIQADPNSPESAGSADGLGRALVKLGRHEDAVAIYREAIRLDPKYARAHYNLGKALAQLNAWDEVVVAYRQAITLEPDLPYIQSDLGEALRQQANRNLQDALACYRQAIQENPGDLKNYHEALDIAPNDVELYVGLANALTRQGNNDGAIVFYQMALQLQPNDRQISLQLAEVIERKKKQDIARSS
jgi:tetratricopeptide (TPR) repeat protein